MIYLIIGVCIGVLLNIGRDYLSFRRGYNRGVLDGVMTMKRVNSVLEMQEVEDDSSYTLEFKLSENKGSRKWKKL